MRQMKYSDSVWIGHVPVTWDIVKIKHALVERKESNSPVKTSNILSLMNDRGVIPYGEKGDIGNKSKENLEDYKLAYPNDIVLNSMNVIIGSVGLSKYFGAVSPVYYMLFKRYENDDIRYFNYIFQTEQFQKSLIGYGNGILAHRMRIQMLKLNVINIPYPDNSLQARISDYLDQKITLIDNIIEKTKQSIEEYKQLKQSIIVEAVTKGLKPAVKMKDSGIEWIGMIPEHYLVVRPHHICKIIRGNSAFQKDDLKDSGDYVALQYGKTYKVDEVNDDYQFYVNDSFYKEYQIVDFGDIILVSTSETIEDLGHSCYYNRNESGLLGGEQMCLKPYGDIVEGKFLYYASRYFRYEVNKYASGLKVYRYNTNNLKKISVIIPPIKEQKNIVSYLDEKIPLINRMILSKEIYIDDLESYKKSLIYEVVTGKKEIV